MSSSEPDGPRRVFLSYARDDQTSAQAIKEAIAQSGVIPADQIVDSPLGEDLTTQLGDNIRVGDAVVLLLSPAEAVAAQGDNEFRLLHYLELRGADLIPVQVAPTTLGALSLRWGVINLTNDNRAGMELLLDQIAAMFQVDFSEMHPLAFENLVADILLASGFVIDQSRLHFTDLGTYLRATYQRSDPFGIPETEVWLVEAKLYPHARASVQIIRQLADYIAAAPPGTRGLLVTNTQLTSVAEEFVTSLERRSNVRLQVLDGADLRRLLRKFPTIVTRHFGKPRPGLRSNGND